MRKMSGMVVVVILASLVICAACYLSLRGDSRPSAEFPGSGLAESDDTTELGLGREGFGHSVRVPDSAASDVSPVVKGVPDPGEADQCEVSVLCLDTDSMAVGGMSVFRIDPAGASYVGMSDIAGRVRTSVKEGARYSFIGTSSTLIGESEPVHQACPPEVTLRARPVSTIKGFVLTSAGLSAGQGITVVAIRGSEPFPSDNTGALALQGSPQRPVAVTGADGAFTLERVARSENFYLVAGGRFLSGRSDSDVIVAGSEDVEIVVRDLYGVVLYVRDGDGPVLTGARALSLDVRIGNPGDSLGSPGSPPTQVPLFLAHLAGLQPSALGGTRVDQYAFFYESASGDARLGPILFEMELPGYEGIRVVLWADKLSSGLAHTTFDAQRVTPGFGALRVVMDGLPEDGAYARHNQGLTSFAKVVLWPVEGGQPLTYLVHDMAPSVQVLDGIPFGRYNARFETSSDYYHFPVSGSVLVTIGDEEARIDVDFSARGSIRVELLNEDGTQFSGYSFIEFYTLDPLANHLGTSSFVGAPYVLAGLKPGTYAVRVGLPFKYLEAVDGGSLVPKTLEVVVSEGECSVVRFLEAGGR